MVSARSTALVVVLLLVAAACGNAGTTTTSASSTTPTVLTIANNGAVLEGHTPTGFSGSGTGLFVGDNLNTSFPDGQGVQSYLSFALPEDLDVGVAMIVSSALHISGTPFEDLGPLLAEPVEYDEFGPDLFDLVAIGETVPCTRVDDSGIECDVTSAVNDAVDRGDEMAQFRLRFDLPADNDGQQDLAMFYKTDSNTNEAGIFQLVITPVP